MNCVPTETYNDCAVLVYIDNIEHAVHCVCEEQNSDLSHIISKGKADSKKE